MGETWLPVAYVLTRNSDPFGSGIYIGDTGSTGTGFGLSVEAEDPFGNLETGFNGIAAIGLQNNPGGSTLSGAYLAAFTGGVASFSGLSLNTLRAYETERVNKPRLPPADAARP